MGKKAYAWIALSFGALALSGACGGTSEFDDDDPVDEDTASDSSALVIPCGGFAGLMCPRGLRCVDIPGDGCDPLRGGADCLGRCVRANQACESPDRRYVSRDPEQCAAIRFVCQEGGTPFFDECGCGCTGERGVGGGELCGGRRCGPRTYCCNASCGICAPLGGVCIQIACE